MGAGPARGGRRGRGRRAGGLPAHEAARPARRCRSPCSGFTTERLGDASRAEELHTQALAASRQLGDERLVALSLEGLAGVAVARGDFERGGELLGLAGHLRDLNGAPSGPASDEVRIGEVILDALGPERFDEVRRQGRDADIDALVP